MEEKIDFISKLNSIVKKSIRKEWSINKKEWKPDSKFE